MAETRAERQAKRNGRAYLEKLRREATPQAQRARQEVADRARGCASPLGTGVAKPDPRWSGQQRRP
jgi:hypothetical protein